MNKNKGFTLIELLAVIVILGIISLIVTPVVTDIILQVKESAKERSVFGYVDAGISYYSKEIMNQTVFNGQINYYDSLEINGKSSQEGIVRINKNGIVKVAIIIDNKCYISDSISKEIKKYSEGEYDVCRPGTTTLDATPGDISNRKVESIEDLVKFAQLVNTDSSIPSILTLDRDLDFQDVDSYADYSTMSYGDLNNNGTVENLMTELTTDNGWIIIGNKIPLYSSSASFEGNNKTISNLYIRRDDSSTEEYIGLFGYLQIKINNLNLKDVDIEVNKTMNPTKYYIGGVAGFLKGKTCSNFNVSGKIKSNSNSYVGGVFGGYQISGSNNIITNVSSSVTIESDDYISRIGGLIGTQTSGNLNLDNVYYNGNINVNNTNYNCYIGGLIGYTSSSDIITNSSSKLNINYRNINSSSSSSLAFIGGLVGLYISPIYIYNSFSSGIIKSNSYFGANIGGLVGNNLNSGQSTLNINNSYSLINIDSIVGYRKDNYIVTGLGSGGEVNNSYYVGNINLDISNDYTGSSYFSPTLGYGNVTNSFANYDFNISGSFASNHGNIYAGVFNVYSTSVITNCYSIEGSAFIDNTSKKDFEPNILINGNSIAKDSINSNWFKNTLNFGDMYQYKDNYYPLVNKCIYDSATSTCTATNELVANQTWLEIQ